MARKAIGYMPTTRTLKALGATIIEDDNWLDKIAPTAKTLQWLTTAPNPRSRATGFDSNQRGWKLHAVETINNSFKQSRLQRSLCGLLPAHGWSMDMFIEDKCIRCIATVKRRQT